MRLLKRSIVLVLIVLLSLLQHACKQRNSWLTPAETVAYTQLTSNSEALHFLERCAEKHPAIRLEINALNDTLLFPIVYFSDTTLNEDNHIRIMLLAGQHGNEPAGMEGLLRLTGLLAEGKHDHWLKHASVVMLPMCNPMGLALHQRRNAMGGDLNRDHLLLQQPETRIIQEVFDKFDPHFTADFHEYYPYGHTWEAFGYLRNFDIQLGGPTNLNTSEEIRYAFANRLLPYVERRLRSYDYSFFEYTLGHLPSGERMRRSTTDIDDGRQSFAITGTFSVIVEGMNGRDSLHRLERRAHSQMLTAEALISWAVQNRKEVVAMVEDARNMIQELPVPVSIRQEHFPDGKALAYPLRSLATGNDTVFLVENYHNKVVSTLDVMPPKGYLIPKNEPLLKDWLNRNSFISTGFSPEEGQVSRYRFSGFVESVDEEIANQLALVEKEYLQGVDFQSYIYVPLNQIYNLRLILALEPQSMYGLINYKEFAELRQRSHWPVLRLE
ncbi:MAG: succinylglutamate desuccinylase/aspartoacylase family protein [Bacteroidetes bacterium]|nr:succinylglutamate desuccinylase/aspartoacylase family protein [Bacteroidota bacterium]